MQTTKIGELSDGQQSRLVFAMICMKNPNLLLLDEPTNHLDIEAIDSLAEAIKGFKGGLVLVSHDFRLIDQVRHHSTWLVLILYCMCVCMAPYRREVLLCELQLLSAPSAKACCLLALLWLLLWESCRKLLCRLVQCACKRRVYLSSACRLCLSLTCMPTA